MKPKKIKQTTTTPSLLTPQTRFPSSLKTAGKNTQKTTKRKTHPKELNEKPRYDSSKSSFITSRQTRQQISTTQLPECDENHA
jgi:hypothetical protein